ncbi:uncharacterized protein LOC117245970 [Epinephelus lanceolatus]
MVAALFVVFAHFWIISLCHNPQTAKPGENVPLHCHCDEDCVISLLEWSRAELKSEQFVLYFRNKFLQNYQLPSYRGRVELMDPEMKNGNASVILKNVTINDTGTYECRIGGKKTRRPKRNTPEVMNTIKLKVTEAGPEPGPEAGAGPGAGPGAGGGGGHLGLSVALVFCGVIVVGLLGFTVRKKFMRKNSEQPAAVAAGEQDPLENSNSKKDECHLNIPLNEI